MMELFILASYIYCLVVIWQWTATYLQNRDLPRWVAHLAAFYLSPVAALVILMPAVPGNGEPTGFVNVLIAAVIAVMLTVGKKHLGGSPRPQNENAGNKDASQRF